ncbi:hypothetical protein RJ639_013146 [Escallonia herrerae]|uniref:Uncharacterized protein n=1 Tax=Escallonia herrerae TaxID=1293975 RepID=A0AA88VHY5_9ASTE|nr:hypothetical protein RJ639_013146 [Escallonia herrerae]
MVHDWESRVEQVVKGEVRVNVRVIMKTIALRNYWTMQKDTRKLSQAKRMVLCRPEIVGSGLYATVDLDKARVARTRMIENEPSKPRWYENFPSTLPYVKDDNPIGATLIGRAYLSVWEIINGYAVDRWIEILDEDHNTIRGASRIHATQDNNWSQGIKSPSFEGVPFTFFKQRHGCQVTLYQDAHVSNDIINKYLHSIGYDEPKIC